MRRAAAGLVWYGMAWSPGRARRAADKCAVVASLRRKIDDSPRTLPTAPPRRSPTSPRPTLFPVINRALPGRGKAGHGGAWRGGAGLGGAGGA